MKSLPPILASIFIGTCILCIGGQVHAQVAQYQPLVGIPGLTDRGTPSLPQYINAIYMFLITFGALFGVIRIALAGVKYSMSDVITDKNSAKADIKGILLGLAILVLPAVVLGTINSNLLKLNIFEGVQKVNLPQESRPSVASATDQIAQTQCGTQGKMYDPTKNPPCVDVPVTAGTRVETCQYDGDPGNGYDGASCRSQCAGKKGTFAELPGKVSGTCTIPNQP